ncbi:CHAD domain-containing protein [Streptomyces sp. NPDC093089]|uniref:CHAD domain-containing protein n=1 Tax=Streptomyces sp. NPDC093089 TaxID=3366024 RepID=UPI00382DC440
MHNPDHSADITAGEVLAPYLHARAADFLRGLRLHHESGSDTAGAEEAARTLRGAARRISGTLHTFRPLLDPAWADHLRTELAWLSGTLALEHACTSRLVRLVDALSRLSNGTGSTGYGTPRTDLGGAAGTAPGGAVPGGAVPGGAVPGGAVPGGAGGIQVGASGTQLGASGSSGGPFGPVDPSGTQLGASAAQLGAPGSRGGASAAQLGASGSPGGRSGVPTARGSETHGLSVGAARAGALLDRQLTLARTRAHSAALQALGSARFHAVADALALLASEVPLGPLGAAPAVEILDGPAEVAERRLFEAVAALPLNRAAHPYNAEALGLGAGETQDAPWHQTRLLLRLHRYASEALHTGGEPDSALYEAARALDRHRDAAEAATAAATAARTPRIAPATAYALGVLHADQRHEVEAARFAFQHAWRRTTAPVP